MLAIYAVKVYRFFISPYLGNGKCRYYPSCSQYSIDAFAQKGFVEGLLLTCWRLLRCNPLSAGGYDPVPGTDPAGYYVQQTKSDK